MKNQKFLNTPWDPTTPLETLINQIEEATEITDASNQPLSAKQVLRTAYTLVFNSGMYFDKCKKWNSKTNDTKYWTTFKYHFLEAQQSLRLQQQTPQHAGFHANIICEQDIASKQEATAAALSNLPTATASDCQDFCAVVEKNTTLTKQASNAMVTIKDLQVNQNRTNPRKVGEPIVMPTTVTVGPTVSVWQLNTTSTLTNTENQATKPKQTKTTWWVAKKQENGPDK